MWKLGDWRQDKETLWTFYRIQEESDALRTDLRAQLKLEWQEMKSLKDRITDLEHELMGAYFQIDAKVKSLDYKITNIPSKICKQ